MKVLIVDERYSESDSRYGTRYFGDRIFYFTDQSLAIIQQWSGAIGGGQSITYSRKFDGFSLSELVQKNAYEEKERSTACVPLMDGRSYEKTTRRKVIQLDIPEDILSLEGDTHSEIDSLCSLVLEQVRKDKQPTPHP
ncbi:MAG TPA: hypothetical protein VJI15_02265 [Candidatus Nanoarchaeia archaeon]|nr:hypothetical protein [Candidatus Nanoarchaeia archaeon]